MGVLKDIEVMGGRLIVRSNPIDRNIAELELIFEKDGAVRKHRTNYKLGTDMINLLSDNIKTVSDHQP